VTIAASLFNTLGGHAGLSTLVGARVYPDIAPMGVASPYVVWSEVGNAPQNNLSGAAPDTHNYRVQVVALAATALQARNVAAQIRLAMAAATEFKSIEVDYASTDFEEGSKVFGVRVDFSIWYHDS
jgi:hypothetical protein